MAFRRRLRRVFRRVCVLYLLVCLIGQGCAWLAPPRFTDSATRPEAPVVQLRYATLPSLLRPVAVHASFASYEPAEGRWRRWEVWQTRGGPFGHVRRDRADVDSDIGGGPTWTAREWRGDEARRLIAALERSTNSYPNRDVYRIWPGPNCNTYAAWVLRRAGVAADLHPKAVGKDYLGWIGAHRTTTGTGVQVETPLIGAKLGLRDGVEIHLFCLTLGADAWPPAVKTPVGRIGFPE